MSPFPYAPRRKRPLSLWNPLDYLVLLYWVFYFPQALRWYVETFGTLPWKTDRWKADSIQRRLAVQGLLMAVAAPFPIVVVLHWLGVPIDFSDVATGLTVGVVYGLMMGGDGPVALGVSVGVAFSVAFGVVSGVEGGAAVGAASGVAVGAVFGMALAAVGAAAFTAVGVVLGVAVGVFAGLVLGVSSGVAVGAAFGVISGVALIAGTLRLDTALFGLAALFPPFLPLAVRLQRTSLLPIPRLRQRLEQQLAQDWEEGLRQCVGLLRYSSQFIPVTAALHKTLAATPEGRLLSHIASWCSRPPSDWKVVYYQAMGLRTGLRQWYWDEFSFMPARWRPRIAVEARHDTPALAACAGFWHLHEGAAQEAAGAFERIRGLPHGEELYANAKAFATALDCESLEQIADWRPPERPLGDLLRPQSRNVFEDLGVIAGDIALVQRSRSVRQRSSALNRASGALSGLAARLADCPEPERALIEQIARQWLEIVLASAGAVGTLEVREPVASPYIVGAPVPAERLAGRRDIFNRLTAAWAKAGQRDSWVIYGQRRIGPTCGA